MTSAAVITPEPVCINAVVSACLMHPLKYMQVQGEQDGVVCNLTCLGVPNPAHAEGTDIAMCVLIASLCMACCNRGGRRVAPCLHAMLGWAVPSGSRECGGRCAHMTACNHAGSSRPRPG